MNYSPDWVLSLACSIVTKRYVTEHVPIEAFTNVFSNRLETMYDDLTGSKLRAGVEEQMRFLAGFNDDHHMEIVKAHIFNVITYVKPGKKRKLKGVFSDEMKPKKTETSIATNSKSFKVFFYQLRSDPKLAPEDSWDFLQVKDIDSLIKVFNSPVLVIDAL